MTDSRKPSTAGPKEKPYVPIEHHPLLGVSEAAALTGLDEKIVRQAIRQGELIACYAHSSTKRIRRRDLDDWISSLPERPQ
ncbi:helix-turn-helix domain-containing protein [Bifidobacterium adolescentis]|nr:helix-turn-helix domain-containing protein [Bifidobacterium adolescentis]MDB0593604.1 helix-turn-helix domain-containing protein [Bifidobacterium adolescentis]MDB0607468.1 helix-turn-helix domain-containing protein [Bifidobacterium adolescentis]